MTDDDLNRKREAGEEMSEQKPNAKYGWQTDDDLNRKRESLAWHNTVLPAAYRAYIKGFDAGVIAGREGYVSEASVEQELQSCQIAMREYDTFRAKLKSEYVPLSAVKPLIDALEFYGDPSTWSLTDGHTLRTACSTDVETADESNSGGQPGGGSKGTWMAGKNARQTIAAFRSWQAEQEKK